MEFIRRGYITLAVDKFYLIIDYADQMLNMGFLPDTRKLMNDMGMPPKHEHQTLMFTATFPVEIQRLAHKMLNDYIFVMTGRHSPLQKICGHHTAVVTILLHWGVESKPAS